MGLQKEPEVLPNIEDFKFKVIITYHVEKYISTKNKKLETYEKLMKNGQKTFALFN